MSWLAATIVSMIVAAGLCPPGHAQGLDSIAVRLEVGASSDYTNELFYEDSFIDTTFLGRQLVDSPESRVAGVALFNMVGTLAQGLTNYRLQNELSLGNKVQRGVLWFHLRDRRSLDWHFSVSPRIEYRHDQTFDRDLQEWRGQIDMSARRLMGVPWTFVEFKGGGDFLRTSSGSSNYLLDRQGGRVGIALENTPLFGSEWRLGYRFQARSFPDSADRNHLEHGWEGRWRRDFLGGHWVQVEADGFKRLTQQHARTSRDNFLENDVTLEGALRWADVGAWRTRLTLEALDYDTEDSVLFFDYQIVRASTGPRFQIDRWTLTMDPRFEALRSPRNRSEQYRELGGAIEIERFGPGGSWWSFTPAAGWRDYDQVVTDDPLDLSAIHSSYAFYELGLVADQPIGAGVRLRLFGSGRIERHVDPAHDARSLYFSLDVRRLF